MKNNIILILIFVIVGIIINSYQQTTIIKNQHLIIHNQELILERDSIADVIISLHRDHLKDCSFIHKGTIRIGYDNYLQVYENGLK